MKGLNAEKVLSNLNDILAKNHMVHICHVYEDLEIFDWFKNTLSVKNQKDMKRFLELALELGYKGYVCFKVGACGCANGMWAHKEESTTGYSPDGECLYRSFSPDYTYYQVRLENGRWIPDRDNYDTVRTPAQLKKLLKEVQS